MTAPRCRVESLSVESGLNIFPERRDPRHDRSLPHKVRLELRCDDEFVSRLWAWFESQAVDVPGRAPSRAPALPPGAPRLPAAADEIRDAEFDEEEGDGG